MKYQPIENYGVIGDLNTCALVGLNGSIDFFCYPQFDSPSVFARLLDHDVGGFFRIAPELDDARQSQLYVPETNVLLTRFMSDQGILETTDFMPVAEGAGTSQIVRIVRSIRGRIPVCVTCAPGFDYARRGHHAKILKGGRFVAFSDGVGGSPDMQLFCSQPMQLSGSEGGPAATSHFVLETGEQVTCALQCDGDGIVESDAQAEVRRQETVEYWQRWSSKIDYEGRWRNTVLRSALLLKLMTSRRYGSMVAAPTFSLPEAINGQRNWDYRYCWVRDSAFTIYAFIRLGLKQEAISFMKWIERVNDLSAKQNGQLQVMYRIDGSRDLEEKKLTHLEGYKCSRPVRIGNFASNQFQTDIYGELLDCIALANGHITKISHDLWAHVSRSVDFVCDSWKRPDAGIWEFRGEEREFLHSKLMCWVAIDRALRVAEQESLPAPTQKWAKVRSEIYGDIFSNFWDDDRKTFVQHRDTKALDASLLLMPLVDFISPHDPRWLSTLDAITEDLACDALVNRYNVGDIDLEPADSSQEGSFNACSFWYIACLARSGRVRDAELMLSKMTGYANHLGLYAEETGRDGRLLGNYPQALSHLALINAVLALSEARQTERAPTG